MIKRTLYIGNPSYLRLKHNQLVVLTPDSHEIKGTIPIEDIAILMLDHAQIIISQQLIQRLMGNTVVVISCDAHHLPNGIMLPLDGHSELTERWRYQIEASLPLKKQLWKQTVVAKITNQKGLLQKYKQPVEAMDRYLESVTTGDEKNMEGKAAAHYWKYILNDFNRHRFGEVPNNLLNFGYAVLRSIVARAIVSSGMLPALGIFHRNKYNTYCLADDIMEPYRPYVDKLVLDWIALNPEMLELTKEAKGHLLTIATQDVQIEDMTRPLLIAVTNTTASLYKCFTSEKRTISYPELYG